MVNLSSNSEPMATYPLDETELRRYLSVPFVAVVYSAENSDGDWSRHAEYPELPGCAVKAPSAIEALDLLEELRVKIIVDTLARGETPPEPRPALASGISGLGSATMQQLLQRVLDGPPAMGTSDLV